ncbi:MAG: outer membrane beta-barrel protein [Bacteroidales bacterium]|nr:outer membrane beta-barrel protein [Bacteroidales bacterium]
MLLVSVLAFAQKPVKFGVYVGGAAPFGQMGEGDELKKINVPPYSDLSNWALFSDSGKQGYASTGVNAGFDVTVCLPVEGLGVFGGIDFFYNSNSSYVKDAMENYAQEVVKTPGISELNYVLPNFMNIPILFGVNYQHDFNHIVGLYCEAGVGPNFRLISDHESTLKYTGSNPDMKVTYSYDAATTLGFKVGAGVMMWNRMSIVADFYSLGSAKINGTEKIENMPTLTGGYTDVTNNFKGENAISASEFVVRVGYHF